MLMTARARVCVCSCVLNLRDRNPPDEAVSPLKWLLLWVLESTHTHTLDTYI